MPSKPPTFKPFPSVVRQIQAVRNETNNKLYNHTWRKARLTFLKRNPLCAVCMTNGKVEEAKHVDHIIPVAKAPERFWDTSNWQALCVSCHSSKTAIENHSKAK